MAITGLWAIGIDLGGTKIEVARVDAEGRIDQRILLPTDVNGGYSAVLSQIIGAVNGLRDGANHPPAGVGIGVAGQIDEQGTIRFAPNLGWRDVSIQTDISRALQLPVIVMNDVRAATRGEWIYGAGEKCDDLVCIFVGTGIGGGIVSNGRILAGCSNTAGEIGHMTIDLNGPICNCGSRGCLEAFAGGWAIARRAGEAIHNDPVAGDHMLKMVNGNRNDVTAKIVSRAFKAGDPLARLLVSEVAQALTAGVVGIVNAFNPCRVILGGGVIEGIPELVDVIDQGVRRLALTAATKPLQIMLSQLHNDAGVIGAASFAIHQFAQNSES